MTPDELIGRLSNQGCDCPHNSKLRKPGLCKDCKLGKPYTVFLLCTSDRCKHTDEECGYFWGPGSLQCGQPKIDTVLKSKSRELYTAKYVRQALFMTEPRYLLKLTEGQPSTWKCDQRTKDLFVINQWLYHELTVLGCPDEDRRFVLNFFNRKSRAEFNLIELATVAINSFLTNTIERCRLH